MYEGIELDYLSPSRKHFPFYKILYLSIKSKDLFTYSILIFIKRIIIYNVIEVVLVTYSTQRSYIIDTYYLFNIYNFIFL